MSHNSHKLFMESFTRKQYIGMSRDKMMADIMDRTESGNGSVGGTFNMRKLPYWGGTLLVALVGSLPAIFFVLVLGLIASEYVIFPLALFVTALVSSVAASWAGTWLSPDGSRTDLPRVVLATLAVGGIGALLVLANLALRLVLLGPIFYLALVCGVLLAVAASLATWRFRTTKAPAREGLLTLGLLVLAVVSVPLVIFVAWLFGQAGA